MRVSVSACLLTTTLLLSPQATASDNALRPVGRIYYDFARLDNRDPGASPRRHDDLRLAWLGVAGRWQDINYRVEVDMVPSRPELREGWLSRDLATPARGTVSFGQMGQHFALDERTSFNHRPALESSYLVQALASPFRIGAGWQGHHAGSFWGATAGSLRALDHARARGRGFSARAGHAPRAQGGDVLHLAASVLHEHHSHPGTGGTAPLRVALNSAGYFSRDSALILADYRQGRDVRVRKHGLEAAGVHGPWSWQAEHAQGRYHDGQLRHRITAVYVKAGWLLTGEHRSYDATGGHFGALRPHKASGAWELVARHDRISSRGNAGGHHHVGANAWTVGVNWYARHNMRVMLDWTDSRQQDPPRATRLDHTRTLAGRVQWNF